MTCHYIIVSIVIISEFYSFLLVIRCNGITILSLFRGVFTVLPVWVTSEGCSFVGKVHSEVTELSMPVFSTGMSLAFLSNAA